MKTLISVLLLALLPGLATAELPKSKQGEQIIYLDQYNGYFAAKDTLAGLKAGKYKFVVNNKAGKLVGFQLRAGDSTDNLAMFPIEPGETGEVSVQLTDAGFSYRCPINPTPWYQVNVK